jgi:hypothetical protein
MNLPATYNQMFVDWVKGKKIAYSDAEEYGVSVIPVADPGQPHWRVIGVHHLTGAENHGQHHLFCDVLDECGQRVERADLTLLNNDHPPRAMTIDKPAHEPGTNTQMYWNDTLTVLVNRDGLPSDKVTGVHTRHEDEEEGTTRGHHSFYVVFQKTSGLIGQPMTGTPGTETGEEAEDLVDALWRVGRPLMLPLNRKTRFCQLAQEQGLGERLTDEYEVMHNGQDYSAQIFEEALVYAPTGHWEQIQVAAMLRTRGETMPNISWTHPVTRFHGNRWNYWEQFLQHTKIPGFTWHYFMEEVLRYNPSLEADGYVFKPDKTYMMPLVEEQAAVAAPPTAPMIVSAPTETPPATLESAPAVFTTAPPTAALPDFARVVDGQFHLKGHPRRFIGVNIRGLVHYGHDSEYFADAPDGHRAIQLKKASEMNARLVRIFLAHKDATPEQIESRLRETLALIKSDESFKDIYLLPALTNLYCDVPFYVQGDEEFYTLQAGGHTILNPTFFKDGYTKNYLPFIRHIVTTFKNEARIFAWEIGNELKAEGEPRLLVDFMINVATAIKSWDPNHMVTTGMISTRQAWMEGRQDLREALYGSPLIDFITIHPYNGNECPGPDDRVEDDSDLANLYNKPFIIEEAGFSLEYYTANRPPKTRADLAYWFGRGASCYMPWGFVATDIDNNDGDLKIGMIGPKHSDFSQLYQLFKWCGDMLLTSGINIDVSKAIDEIDYSPPPSRGLPDKLPWPMVTDGFDFPVGKPHGQGYYVATDLVNQLYYAEHKSWHTGEDWRRKLGSDGILDAELGDPVYAVANGRVVTSYQFPNWGNIVLLEHRLPWGQTVWSQYAHLKQRLVRKGDVVHRGEQIGIIGKGDQDQYPAHLHFEIRLKKLPASKDGWQAQADRERVLQAYTHPTNFINSNRPR